MAKRLKTLSNRQCDWLKWALDRARQWRGEKFPDEFAAFDADIASCKAAVDQAIADRRRLLDCIKLLREFQYDKGDAKLLFREVERWSAAHPPDVDADTDDTGELIYLLKDALNAKQDLFDRSIKLTTA